MCNLVREQAFDKLDMNMVIHVLTQIIRFLKGKEFSNEKIFKQLLGRSGVLKVYDMFNNAQIQEVRKLSGRLLMECLNTNVSNQDFLCDLLDFQPMNGRVCLNQEIPPLIKQKIQTNSNFLSTILNFTEVSSFDRKFWCFPEFKEQQKVAADSNFLSDSNSNYKEQSLKLANFPDPTLYLVGFKYKSTDTQKDHSELQAGAKIDIDNLYQSQEIANVNLPLQSEDFLTSTQNQHLNLISQPIDQRQQKTVVKTVRTQSQHKSSIPYFVQKNINRIQTLTSQFKTTTNSTESQNRNGTTGTSGNDTSSQKSYRKHKSISEHRKISERKTLKIKSSLINKNRQRASNEQINQTQLKSLIQTTIEMSERSQSPAPIFTSQESPPRNPGDINKLIKLLNKPEMLLLNHLQNQIKYYYPQSMNKHLQMQQTSPPKQQNFLEAVEKQRKIISDQTQTVRQRYAQAASISNTQNNQKQRNSISNKGSHSQQQTTSPQQTLNSNYTPKRDSYISSNLTTSGANNFNSVSARQRKGKVQTDNVVVSKRHFAQHQDRQRLKQKQKEIQISVLQTQLSRDTHKFRSRESFDQSNDSGIPVVSAAANASSSETQNIYTAFF